MGKFITLEGIDGAGKSTHLAWLQAYLEGRGLRVVLTREPGGTPLGEALREVLLHQPQAICAETEALLMFAARREHLQQVILPALARGDWVVSDRFTDASFAYQGGGRGVETGRLEALEKWVQGDFQPNLTIYFDVPVALGKARVSAIKSADRFEKEQDDFFERVRAAYLERARKFPQRIRVIDSSLPLSEVNKLLEEIILYICK